MAQPLKITYQIKIQLIERTHNPDTALSSDRIMAEDTMGFGQNREKMYETWKALSTVSMAL